MNVTIQKVTVKSNRVSLSVTEMRGDSEVLKDLKQDSRMPHPDLLDALESFKFHLARNIFRDTLEEVTKTQLAINFSDTLERLDAITVQVNGAGQSQSIHIAGTQKTYGGKKNTLQARVPIGESSPYPFRDEIVNDWESLQEEAALFYSGQKFHVEQEPESQLDIFPDSLDTVEEEDRSVLADQIFD